MLQKKITIFLLAFLLAIQLIVIVPIGDVFGNQQNQVTYQKSSDKISLQLSEPAWYWESVGEEFALTSEASFSKNIPGLPAIPYFSTLLAIPWDGDFEVQVDLSDTEKLSPPGKMHILESQFSGSFDQESLEVFSEQNTCEKIFPETSYFVDSPAWVRDQRVVRVVFFPFQWDCKNQLWTYTPQIKIDLVWKNLPDSVTKNAPQNNHIFDDLLMNSLINYQDGLAWQGKNANEDQDLQTLSATSMDLNAGVERIRITVINEGVYQVRYEDLQFLGSDLLLMDPHFFYLENQGRPVKFYLDADDDALFESGERIVFYGEKLNGEYLASLFPDQDDHWIDFSNGWSPQFNAEMIEKYADENIYWLSASSLVTEKMNEIHQSSFSPTAVGNFPYLQEFEHDLKWRTLHFTSEETWFLDSNIIVGATPVERNLPFSLMDIDFETDKFAELQLELTSETLSALYNPDHQIEIFLNDQFLQSVQWDGRVWQSIRIPFAQNLLLRDENNLKIRYLSIGSNYSNRFSFDQFNVLYHRMLIARENELIFSTPEEGDFSYTVTGLTDPDLQIWNISDPLQSVRLLDYGLEDQAITFSNLQSNKTNYIVFGASSIRTPEMQTTVVEDFNSELTCADYLIISPREFISPLQPFVDWRTNQGLKVKIVDLQTIYNQFNFGISHPIAIKNFMKSIFQSWETPPTYVLFVGDGHWDLKNNITSLENYFPPNFVWVDPVQGEIDSLSDLVAVVGDDPIPDALIGRFPVNTEQELTAIISKIIAFEQSQGEWLKKLSFVADNYFLTDGCFDEDPATICTTESGGNFAELMDTFLADVSISSYQVYKFYQDVYQCIKENTPACDQLTTDLLQNINQSPSQIYTYSGHGAIRGWANERIFIVDDIPSLNNNDQYPVFFSLDCIDGFWYYPPGVVSTDNRSLSEELLRASESGASAVYSATGFGYATGHDILQRGFFETFLGENNPTLGEADFSAKLKVYASGNNDEMLFTYMIFGDPAMRMFNDRFFSYFPLLHK